MPEKSIRNGRSLARGSGLRVPLRETTDDIGRSFFCPIWKERRRGLKLLIFLTGAKDIRRRRMIVFRNGKPERASYRHFKIKAFEEFDDYRAMAEVIMRRVDRLEDVSFGESTGSDSGRREGRVRCVDGAARYWSESVSL